MKKKLLIYTDCYLFGGCENVVINIISNSKINERFNLYYSYARNPDYEAGVAKRLVGVPVPRYPLNILDNTNLFYRIDRYFRSAVVGFTCKLPFFLIQKLGLYNLYNFIRLFFFFRSISPDILHINNGGYPAAQSCLVAVYSAWAAGVRNIVFTVNNLARKPKSFIGSWSDRFIESRVNYFITASVQARDILIENRGFSQDKVIQIVNALLPECATQKRGDLLTSLAIPAEKFVVVCVGFLTARKGQRQLLQAFAAIRDKDMTAFSQLFLILVGEGEDRVLLEQIINEQHLNDNVAITGYRHDYFDFINAADLFVLPSVRDEDMPLVVLSAMSLGKPIISTKVAGIVEEIRDGVDGILIEPEQLSTLDQIILQMFYSPEQRGHFGVSARQRYQELFAVERVMEQQLAMYEKLMDTCS